MTEACKHNFYDSQPDLLADYEAARSFRVSTPDALVTIAVQTMRVKLGVIDNEERLKAIRQGIVCGAGGCAFVGAEVKVEPVNDGSVDHYQPPVPRESLETPLTA